MKFGTRCRDRDAVGVDGMGNGEGELPNRPGGLWGSRGQKRIWRILSVAERLWFKDNQVFRETFITAYTSARTVTAGRQLSNIAPCSLLSQLKGKKKIKGGN